MKESRIDIDESQKVAFVERLWGEVFHVTFARNLESIKKSGGVLVNTDGTMKTTFGDATNSIFRRKGCVSVFDYECCSMEKWREYMWKCDPLQNYEKELAFLFLGESAKRNLIRWRHVKDEWKSERVVPHVEAGHKGTIPLSDVAEIIIVRVIVDSNSLASILKRSRHNFKRKSGPKAIESE